MRVSGTRYRRDARRLELAWKLIGFAARTPTIKRWTGLSIYQIRALYRTRITADPAMANSPIYGAAPSQVGFFWQSALIMCEVTILAGFLRVFEVLPEIPGQTEPDLLPGILRGEHLCKAYAEFRALAPGSKVTIEHGMLLLTELARGTEMAFGVCKVCRALLLVDKLAIGPGRCAYCYQGARMDPSISLATAALTQELARPSHPTKNKQVLDPGTQGSLF